ncbi:pentapeptide repeat-containing protein [Desulfonema limicola]|nr:pentapeptide repeat-containing protein [Desulfonema limicola]
MDIEKIINHYSYQELKTEIKICKPGAIFSIVCPDDAVIHGLIENMQQDMNHDIVSLFMSEDDTDFQSFFQQNFDLKCETENAGEQNPGNGQNQDWETKKIINISGINNLNEDLHPDLIGCIQYLSICLRSVPYIVALWITPEFEKQIFFYAPDIWHQITGKYDFSPLMPYRAELKKSEQPLAIPQDKIIKYLENIIQEYKNWKNLHKNNQPFLIEAMGNSDLNNYYLPSSFANKKGQIFLLDDLLKVFIENRKINFLTLLGEPGTGKTSFAVYYYIKLAEQYINNPDNTRIPIFISLKDYKEKFDPEGFFIEMFKKIFDVKLSLIKLQDMLLRGKFVFFIDDFDKMALSSDLQSTIYNLKAVTRLSVKNIILEKGIEKPQPSNKVFFTCPTHYYLVDIKGENTSLSDYTSICREFAAKENFQIVRLNNKEFDEPEFKDYVVKNTKNSIIARNILGIMNDPYIVNKLSNPSILSRMIIRTLPVYQDKKEINAADLYRAFTDMWIKCDDWRFKMTPLGRQEFLHRLALNMFQKGDGHFIHFSEAYEPDQKAFKENSPDNDRIICRDEILTCEFLDCDPDGNYRFIHRSFMDYFIAEFYFLNILHKNERPVAYSHLEEEVRVFMKLIISSAKTDLKGLNLSDLDLENVNLYQADLSGADLSRTNLANAVLMNANLQNADLTTASLLKAKLTRVNCTGADLSGADFSEARLRDAILHNARFNGANLHSADMRGCKLCNARLAWADLTKADLSEADLTGANLTDTDLTDVNLDKAILCEADLTGSNMAKAVLTGADFSSSKLNNVDLSSVNLSKTNFKWAELQNADFSLADLTKVKFVEADLTRGTFDDSKCREADFRWAKLQGAKLRYADLSETDFSGANLTKAKLSEADLTWANLTNAVLINADLTGAKLNMCKAGDADFTGANLSSADLTWADMTKANFTQADLSDANLSEADLTQCRFNNAKLSRASFKGASLQKADLRNTVQDGADFTDADLTDIKK